MRKRPITKTRVYNFVLLVSVLLFTFYLTYLLFIGIVGKNSDEIARLASIEYKESVGDCFEIAWSESAVEIVAKGVDKAKGLNFILSKYGIKNDEVLVAGDSGNDLPLFENFEHSFVMSHAPEEVKSKAKHVIETVADLKEYCKE